jgi:hypothetical protein
MKLFFFLLTVILLTACSDDPRPQAKSKENEPLPPLTGRQALQQTLGPARAWAADSQPLRVRSMNLENIKSADGKAGLWEIVYISQARSRARRFVWSAIDSGESLHQGVFGEHDEAWTGFSGNERLIPTAALMVDTPEALKTAMSKSGEYLKKDGPKPPVSYALEATSRFVNPVWRVMWGNTASTAQWSVFVDASTGQYRGN